MKNANLYEKSALTHKTLLREFLEAHKEFNSLMDNKCYVFALEKSTLCKEYAYLLYSGGLINEVQFHLLFTKGQKLFWLAYNKVVVK